MSTLITATRHHEIACGHRVCGHENKCAHLHGHNYRIHFTVAGPQDAIGRIMDFSVIKSRLCMWLEDEWDHRFLLWEQDPWLEALIGLNPDGVVAVPFNPTAENMAAYLLETVGPRQLAGTGCTLTEVRVEETTKCSAGARLG